MKTPPFGIRFIRRLPYKSRPALYEWRGMGQNPRHVVNVSPTAVFISSRVKANRMGRDRRRSVYIPHDRDPMGEIFAKPTIRRWAVVWVRISSLIRLGETIKTRYFPTTIRIRWTIFLITLYSQMTRFPFRFIYPPLFHSSRTSLPPCRHSTFFDVKTDFLIRVVTSSVAYQALRTILWPFCKISFHRPVSLVVFSRFIFFLRGVFPLQDTYFRLSQIMFDMRTLRNWSC